MPGLGIASVFYAIAALLAPFREIVLTIRGRSSLRRWRLVGRQFTLAVLIVGAIVGFYVALAALERHGVVAGSSGSQLLTRIPNVAITAAVLFAVLVSAALGGWLLRLLTDEESAESIAAAHRAGVAQAVIDLRDVARADPAETVIDLRDVARSSRSPASVAGEAIGPTRGPAHCIGLVRTPPPPPPADLLPVVEAPVTESVDPTTWGDVAWALLQTYPLVEAA